MNANEDLSVVEICKSEYEELLRNKFKVETLRRYIKSKGFISDEALMAILGDQEV